MPARSLKAKKKKRRIDSVALYSRSSQNQPKIMQTGSRDQNWCQFCVVLVPEKVLSSSSSTILVVLVAPRRESLVVVLLFSGDNKTITTLVAVMSPDNWCKPAILSSYETIA